jgi:hypothetical protein
MGSRMSSRMSSPHGSRMNMRILSVVQSRLFSNVPFGSPHARVVPAWLETEPCCAARLVRSRHWSPASHAPVVDVLLLAMVLLLASSSHMNASLG